MEKNKIVEKPEWVKIVEILPEIVRQAIGNQCASVIASLVQISLCNRALFFSVVDDATSMVNSYSLSIGRSEKDDKGV